MYTHIIYVRGGVKKKPFSLICVVKFRFLSSPVNSVSESLEESAAAYTKATAKKCILEKVDVKTGEESESNVLQVRVGPRRV